MKNIEFEKEGLKELFEVSRSNHINCSFYLYKNGPVKPHSFTVWG